MKIAKLLVSIRDKFDDGEITEDEFVERVNATLGSIVDVATDAEKIAAFDSIAETIRESLIIEEIDSDGMVGVKDVDSYISEDAMRAIIGDAVFDGFYNKTYEGR